MTDLTINIADLEHMHDLAQEIEDLAALMTWAADPDCSNERPFGKQAARIQKLAQALGSLLPKQDDAE